MRSPRFDAALRDYGEVLANYRWVSQGDIVKIAVRHSSNEQEFEDILAFLNKESCCLPRVSAQPSRE